MEAMDSGENIEPPGQVRSEEENFFNDDVQSNFDTDVKWKQQPQPGRINFRPSPRGRGRGRGGSSRFDGNWNPQQNQNQQNNQPSQSSPQQNSQTSPSNGQPSQSPVQQQQQQPPPLVQPPQQSQQPPPNQQPQFGFPGTMQPGMMPPGTGNLPLPHHPFGGPPPHMMQELWVETKTEDGKSYYYHAISRETTWNRPEGPHIKIMTQAEIENMNKMQQQKMPEQKPHEMGNDMNKMPPNQGHPGNMMEQQPPPFMPGSVPFGMPPPTWNPPPWNQAGPTPPWQTHPPADPHKMFNDKIDPQIIAKAAEWSEHRAPDGRPYYYHAGRGESVWERPQALKELDEARMAATQGPPVIPQQMMPLVAPNINVAPPHQASMQGNVMFDSITGAFMKPDAQKPANELAEIEKEKKRKELEKKKKEEEANAEKIKQNAKPQDKSRPISSTPISGTPWCVVWTGDSRVFFYNPSTRTSVWDRPVELLGRPDVDKAVSSVPEQLLANKEPAAKESGNLVTGDSINDKKSDESSDEEEVPLKKMKIDTNDSTNKPAPPVGEKKVDQAKEGAIEAEVRAAKERASVPLEIRVKQFKEMLKEKEVSAFSTWEKELHKIVFDPRYLLLASRERKQVFEKYVKDRAEEERREKRNKIKQNRDDFRALMEKANLHGKSSFNDFCQKYSRDDRYKGIEKLRERESLYNEYILELRKKEKNEKQHKKEQIKKDFFTMLREHSDIDRHSRWMDVKKKLDNDARYKAVADSVLREDYFYDYLKVLKEEKKERKKEKEHKKERKSEKKDKKDKDRDKDKDKEKHHKDKKDKDKDKKSDKDKDKEKEKEKDKDKDKEKEKVEKEKIIIDEDNDIEMKEVEDDHKDKESEAEKSDRKDSDKEDSSKSDTESEKDQEDGEHSGTSDDDESERKKKERQARAEASIKEREKEVQRTLANHLRDRDKEREHHKRDEAIRHFTALLADLVRNPDLSWKEIKKQLKKDHRWELCDNLDRDDRERLFNDHIGLLIKKKRDKFREMLDEISTLELTSSWKEVKKQIKEDPRYLKFNSSERCEREFREYIIDKTHAAKSAFRELLQECKLITHKSYEKYKENSNYLKEIEDILKNDKRYLVLDHMSKERTQMILEYLDILHKRGVPAPPTASESLRRK